MDLLDHLKRNSNCEAFDLSAADFVKIVLDLAKLPEQFHYFGQIELSPFLHHLGKNSIYFIPLVTKLAPVKKEMNFNGKWCGNSMLVCQLLNKFDLTTLKSNQITQNINRSPLESLQNH